MVNPRQLLHRHNRPTSVAGTWSLEIDAGKPIYANVTLVQSEDAVFGKGKIMDENDTQTAVASGSIKGDMLNLDLVSLEDLRLYRLSMTVSGNSVTGSDKAFRFQRVPLDRTCQGIEILRHYLVLLPTRTLAPIPSSPEHAGCAQDGA